MKYDAIMKEDEYGMTPIMAGANSGFKAVILIDFPICNISYNVCYAIFHGIVVWSAFWKILSLNDWN